MQLGTTRSMYVMNRVVHGPWDSHQSMIWRDTEKVFTVYSQAMA
jgi:hypothetical protein